MEDQLHPCTRCGDCYRIPAERAEDYICPICQAEMSGMEPLVTSGTRKFRHWLQAGGNAPDRGAERPEVEEEMALVERLGAYAKSLRAEVERLRAENARLRDKVAWDEDESDMAQIAREWADYDRDPPGS